VGNPRPPAHRLAEICFGARWPTPLGPPGVVGATRPEELVVFSASHDIAWRSPRTTSGDEPYDDGQTDDGHDNRADKSRSGQQGGKEHG